MPHYVYKYVYGNEIIYIGKTDTQLSNRISQHGVSGDNIDKCGWDEINASSIYYIELVNSTMADVVESELIRRYRPKYNKAKMSEWSGIQFVEPEWKLYKTKQQIKTEIENLQEIIEEKNKELEELQYRLEIQAQQLDIQAQHYERELSELEKNNVDLIKEIADLKKYKDLFVDITRKCDLTYKLDDNGKTLGDILQEYKTTDKPFIYISKAYDSKGNLNCEKTIYTEGGGLRYQFNQNDTVSASGYIYGWKSQKTMTNYPDVRAWLNRGSNVYYKVL